MKKRKFSPAQLAAQKRFAALAKAGKLRRKNGKKKNTTIIKAKKISHLDVSKVHNGKKRTVSARRNAEHRDAAHPIHVRDYWQGRKGYKSQWQRAHEAGQRQLFGVKNPGMTAEQQAIQKAWEFRMKTSKEWKNYEKALMDAYEENSPYMIKRADSAYKKWEALVKRTKPFKWDESKRQYVKNPRRGTRKIAGFVKRVTKTLGRKTPSELTKRHAQVKIQNLRGKRAVSAVARRRNGANTNLAKQRRAEFVGRPSTKTKTLYAPNGSGASGTLAQLGKLHKLHIKGGKTYNFKGVPTLAQHPKTDQLFVLGKNYTVNAPKKNPGDRMVDLGEVKTIEYEAVKTHLGDSKPVRYYHHFGEEGGERPHALVNEEGLIIFSGGDYYIRPEGIRD